MSNCKHTRTTQGEHFGYTGPVSVHDQNRAAHGGVTYTETCSACGAERAVNQNQGHYEYGRWITRAERESRGQPAPDPQSSAAKERLARAGATVTRSGSLITVRIDQRASHCQIDEIRAAAAQLDNGDGLVPFYRDVLLAVGA